MAAIPKRGRPVTTGTTPSKDRAAKSRSNRSEAGGKRLSVNLTPEGARHLREIMEDRQISQTEAVHFALARGSGY